MHIGLETIHQIIVQKVDGNIRRGNAKRHEVVIVFIGLELKGVHIRVVEEVLFYLRRDI